MELPEYASEHNMKINLDYYMTGGVNGQLARLVVYHQQFQEESVDDSDEELKKADIKTYKNACKYIDDYCKTYYKSYVDKGKVYKKIYKISKNTISNQLMSKINNVKTIVTLLNGTNELDEFKFWFINKAKTCAVKLTEKYGERYLYRVLAIEPKPHNRLLISLQNAYFGKRNNISIDIEKRCKLRHNVLESKLNHEFGKIAQLRNLNKTLINRITAGLKNQIGICDRFNDDNKSNAKTIDVIKDNIDTMDISKLTHQSSLDINVMMSESNISVMNVINKIYFNMASNFMLLEKTRSLVNRLKYIRNKTAGSDYRPITINLSNIKADIDAIVNEIIADKR
jgi:hypothetical protein